jgi:hypothetical protein
MYPEMIGRESANATMRENSKTFINALQKNADTEHVV